MDKCRLSSLPQWQKHFQWINVSTVQRRTSVKATRTLLHTSWTSTSVKSVFECIWVLRSTSKHPNTFEVKMHQKQSDYFTQNIKFHNCQSATKLHKSLWSQSSNVFGCFEVLRSTQMHSKYKNALQVKQHKWLWKTSIFHMRVRDKVMKSNTVINVMHTEHQFATPLHKSQSVFECVWVLWSTLKHPNAFEVTWQKH